MSSLPSIALFGAGTHGLNAVLPALLQLRERLSLCGIVEPFAPSREKIVARGIDVPIYDSAEALFATQTPGIAYIATLPKDHEWLTLAALEAGCHVVCEKPLAPTVAECERMVAAARKAKRLLVTMFESRYMEHYRQIREWILTGRIGRVEAIHWQKLGTGPVVEPRRTNLINASGSLDCGIHSLDLTRYFVDGGDWEIIHALGQWFEEPHLENPPHTAILARLERGPLMTINDSMSYRVAYAKQTGDRSGVDTLAIVGTQGVIEEVPGGFRMRLTDNSEEFVKRDASTHADEIPWVIKDLLQAIETGAPPSGFMPTGKDGLLAQRLVEEANRQANQSRRLKSV